MLRDFLKLGFAEVFILSHYFHGFVGSAIAEPSGHRAGDCYRQLGSMLPKDGERGKDAR
jgi:hypothetical protein